MAKIRHPHLFRFEHFESGKRATVGNNRTVEHEQRETASGLPVRVIKGRLHGHCIFHVETYPLRSGAVVLQITLDTHGYQTSTTRAAMEDFLKAAGIRAGVSLARGELRVWFVHDDGTHTPWRFSGGARKGSWTFDAETLTPCVTESANV